MADYYGKGRSNIFKPKDPERLGKIVKYYHLTSFTEVESGTVSLFAEDEDGGIESFLYLDDESNIDEMIELGLATEEDRGEEEIELPDFYAIIAKELLPGQFLFWTHIGSEGRHSLSGYTTAVNEYGEQLYVDLESIGTMIVEQWINKDKNGA
jgi:hypothetical protein